MKSLATQYRPTTFEECCGQESIIKIMRRQLELDQVKNCYLFCGASGCGKTTTARIFANEINKHQGKPIEIDGASNNGVDNVRELIKNAAQRSIESKYKIIIVDECHALSNAAWQAFLKCLEETPEFTIFIFCTTDPQKIPATIINRCMRFNFTRLTPEKIRQRLEFICEKESFTNYGETVDYISRTCKGQLRDAIADLEKAASYNSDLSIENTIEALGAFSYVEFFDMINNIIDGKQSEIMATIESLYNRGKDLRLFIDEFLAFNLDLLNYSLIHEDSILQIPASMHDDIVKATSIQDADKYYSYVVDRVLSIKNTIKSDSNPKNTTEVMLLQIARCQ